MSADPVQETLGSTSAGGRIRSSRSGWRVGSELRECPAPVPTAVCSRGYDTLLGYAHKFVRGLTCMCVHAHTHARLALNSEIHNCLYF